MPSNVSGTVRQAASANIAWFGTSIISQVAIWDANRSYVLNWQNPPTQPSTIPGVSFNGSMLTLQAGSYLFLADVTFNVAQRLTRCSLDLYAGNTPVAATSLGGNQAWNGYVSNLPSTATDFQEDEYGTITYQSLISFTSQTDLGFRLTLRHSQQNVPLTTVGINTGSNKLGQWSVLKIA